MPYWVIDHTADIGLFIRAKTHEELYNDGVRGLMELLDPAYKDEQREIERVIHTAAEDATDLFVRFLNEVLYTAHTYKEGYTTLDIQKHEPTEIIGILRGRRVDTFQRDLKAVTYHNAAIEHADDYYEITLIFDL